jgi:NAD(P)H-flavin reductase
MGLYWLIHPVTWHSSRKSGYPVSKLTPQQLGWIHSRFLDWYKADWTYGRGTVYFFSASLTAFFLGNLFFWFHQWRLSKSKSSHAPLYKRVLALVRFFGARQFCIERIDYYSPPLNAIIAILVMITFFFAFALGRHPYIWPVAALGNSPPLATRTGWISIGMLPFLFAFSTKVNYVGMVTGTSHEKLQVYHRWTAWIMYVSALIHTFMFIHWHIHHGDMRLSYHTKPWYWSGIAALVPQSWLVFMSWGPIRSRFYETFKKLHFFAAGFFMAGLFVHCNFRLTSWDYFWATLAVYGSSWLLRVVYMTLGNGVTKRATFQALPANMVKVVIQTNTKWSPGQHYFIRFLSLGIHSLSSHPFTVASIPKSEQNSGQLELFVRGQNGITGRLVKFALGTRTSRVLLDGPYGGIQGSLKIYDRVLLVAGGSGSTFVMPVLLDLMRGYHEGMNCKQIELVWVVPNTDEIFWFDQVLDEAIRDIPDSILTVSVFVTGSTPATLEVKPHLFEVQNGRPNIPLIVQDSCTGSGTLAVATCGPDCLTLDVRNAVAKCELAIAKGSLACKEIFLHTEAYSW